MVFACTFKNYYPILNFGFSLPIKLNWFSASNMVRRGRQTMLLADFFTLL